MTDFDLGREIDRYATRIASDIRNRKKRLSVKEEYAEHLEDATDRYMKQGMTDAEAFAAACADLGSMAEMQTLLTVTHNGDGLPQWFSWFVGGMMLVGLGGAYCLAPWEPVRIWVGIAFGVAVIVGGVFLVREVALLIRAVTKRRSAKQRISRFAAERGMTVTQHKNPYVSLIKSTVTPEWVMESDRRRYIIHLFPTVHTRRILHLHESGLYTCPRRSMFFMRLSRGSVFFPMGLSDTPAVEQSRGMFRMPPVAYADFHRPDKENVHIFLLNPVPYDGDICEGGHIRKIFDGDRLPERYGNAFVFTASGFLAHLNAEKI